MNTTGRSRDAEDNYRESVAILESLLTRSPADRDLKYKLIRSQFFMARTIPPHRPKEIETLDRLVVDNAGALVADDTNNPEYRMLLANGHNALGRDLIGLRRWPESEANHRQALAILQRLMEEFHKLPFYRVAFAHTLHTPGKCVRQSREIEEVEQTRRQAREIREKLAAEHPEVPDFQNSIAGSLNNMATRVDESRPMGGGPEIVGTGHHSRAGGVKMNPNNKYYRQYLNIQLNNLTGVQLAMGTRMPPARQQTIRRAAYCRPRIGELDRSDSSGSYRGVNQPHGARYVVATGSPRQEPLLAGKILCVKALIRQTIELAADDPKQYQLADLLTTAPEELRDP